MSVTPQCIGIDLGTTNSVAACIENGRVRFINQADHGGLVPSVLSWQPPARGEIEGRFLVGRSALNNLEAAPEDTVRGVKRLMGRWFHEEAIQRTIEEFDYRILPDENGVLVEIGGHRLSPPEISARYLNRLKQLAETELQRPVTSAVITVPAYFEERQRAATRLAGEKAGLVVKKIIDEPTAAAIAYGMEATDTRGTLLVFDLGGGTFDITITHLVRSKHTNQPAFEVAEIDGDNWLGGQNFDQLVVEHLVEQFQDQHQVDPRQDKAFMATLRRHAERARIELSQRESASIVLPGVYQDSQQVLGVNATLTRAELERLIAPDVDRAIALVHQALKNRTIPSERIAKVLLVGGGTKTPLVRRELEKLFGRDKICEDSIVDPMTAVAQGAAIYAQQMRGIECPNEQCGEPEARLDRKTGMPVTVTIHTVVEDETQSNCPKCGTSLATGKAVTEGFTTSDTTACSLGILAVKGDQHDAYVSLISKGTAYPLSAPVKRIFHPFGQKTRLITVPVFEAKDDMGTERYQQGVLYFELNQYLTSGNEVEVSFNLDRNRQVTVSILVPGLKMTPLEQHLVLAPPPDVKAAAEKQAAWPQQLENLLRHTGNMYESYSDYLRPNPLQKAKVNGDMEKAALALNDAEQSGAYSQKGLEAIHSLEQDLFYSGPASQLYLADLAQADAGDSATRNRIIEAQTAYKSALDEQNAQAGPDQAKRLKDCEGRLKAAMAEVFGKQAGPSSGMKEIKVNINTLLRADGS
jgi:molecular chaperone DnaK